MNQPTIESPVTFAQDEVETFDVNSLYPSVIAAEIKYQEEIDKEIDLSKLGNLELLHLFAAAVDDDNEAFVLLVQEEIFVRMEGEGA